MRVLIIKTSSLGDIIHALPVLDYLHQVAPGIVIDWAVEEQFSDLLSGNPLLSALRVVRTRRWRQQPLKSETIREIRTLWRELRDQRYDRVFDIQGNLKSGIIAQATGAKQRIGFDLNHVQEPLNALFTTRRVSVLPSDQHASDRYLRVVGALFSHVPSSLNLKHDIVTTPEDDAFAREILASFYGNPVFLFHAGTTWQTKLWHEAGWIGLAGKIMVQYPDAGILLSWGNDSEREVVTRIAAEVGDRARVLERLSLKQFAALMKNVHIVVGGDTGPIHLAAAVGTPTVSFYRSTVGSLNGPRGECHVIVQSPLECTKCLRSSCDRTNQCVESITVEAMFEAVSTILNGDSFRFKKTETACNE